jgi:hypothetical protein
MAEFLPPNYIVKYVPGERVTARYDGFRLMAFDSKVAALGFHLGTVLRPEVWRAEAEGACLLERMPRLSETRDGVSRFWRLFKAALLKTGKLSQRHRPGGALMTPDGTLACASIKLIERVA